MRLAILQIFKLNIFFNFTSFFLFFRSLAPLSSQKVSYISFQNTDNLQVYFSDLASGDKTVIVDNVAYLTLSGRMYERAASMRFFVRNSPSVLFEDFYATTPILLINLMVSFNFKEFRGPLKCFVVVFCI